MTSSKKRSAFQYNLWKYLLVIILPIVLWYAVFYFVYRTRDNEQVKILFWGDGLDISALGVDLTENAADIAGDKIKNIEVKNTAVKQNFGQLVSAYMVIYDIIIFPQDLMEEHIGQNRGFVSFKEEKMTELFGAAAIYAEESDGNTLYYAVKFSADSRFSAYYSGGEECYMFFSSESVNLGKLNGRGNESDVAALKIAQYLAEEE